MSLFLYNLFLILYATGIQIASLFNPKAKLWINGRENIFDEIKSKIKNQNPIAIGSKIIWMHCASLGEFEQGRPVIENIRKIFPDYKIVLTFFSPSGYEIRKNYTGADMVLYLPMDGRRNAKKFIDSINPCLVIWVKYEYWYYYLTELKNRNIPVLLVSGIFREGQPFFKWYGAIWKKMLGSFSHLFVQTKAAADLLQQAGIHENVSISGDTRFDRVTDIAAAFEPLSQQLINFCAGSKVLVAGSTWEEDEAELIHYVKAHPEIKFIIAPHEVDKENLQNVKKEFHGSMLYSQIMSGQLQMDYTAHILIIDNIGMLARLYYYADVTYVGGGFGESGIHNVLEAAVYGKPVIFGPEYEKAAEAEGLIETGGAFSINNALELEAILNKLFENDNHLQESGIAAKNYVYANRGATKKIIKYIQEKRLLIN